MAGKDRAILSKSTFIRGLQCEKSLYLHKKRPFLRDAVTHAQLDKFSRGTDVGQYALLLFPEGVNAAPKTHFQIQASVALTAKYLAEGQKVIYEAAFRHNDVIVALDILVLGDKGWHAIEVKSSLAISETYLWDAALQFYVLTGAGMHLADFSIAYVNSDYQRDGSLDTARLFKIESVFAEVLNRQPIICQKVERLKEVPFLEKAPGIPVGKYCHEPYPCDFIGHCWKNIPAGSVFDLYGLDENRKYSLFYEGIVPASQIPSEELEPLTTAIHAASLTSGKIFSDNRKLRFFMTRIKPPAALVWCLYIKPALPVWDGTSPYQALPVMIGLQDIDSEKDQQIITIPDGLLTEEILKELSSTLAGYSTLFTFGSNPGFDAISLKVEGAINRPSDGGNSSPAIIDLAAPFSDFSIVWPKMGRFGTPGELLESLGKHAESLNTGITVLQGGQIPTQIAGKEYRFTDIHYATLQKLTRATLSDMAGLCALIREFAATQDTND